MGFFDNLYKPYRMLVSGKYLLEKIQQFLEFLCKIFVSLNINFKLKLPLGALQEHAPNFTNQPVFGTLVLGECRMF